MHHRYVHPLLRTSCIFLLTFICLRASCLSQTDSTDSYTKIPYRVATVGWVKLYPFNFLTGQYRLGLEKIISSRFSGVLTLTGLTQGPYGKSDDPVLRNCQLFLPASGLSAQVGIRHYLQEEKSNWHWFVEGNFFYQRLSYREFSYVPSGACAQFHPWFKRIAPLQRDLGFSLYVGQQLALADHFRVESFIGFSVRTRREDQRQTTPDTDPTHYTTPAWFQEFRQVRPPFSRNYLGLHVGIALAFGG